MSQADELLSSLSEEEISAYTVDPTTEPHIVINSDRTITVPDVLKRIAVQHDHNVETVTFDCPRYWDGIDMSGMSVYISYMRSDNVRSYHKVTNVTVDESDSSIIHFDWTISGHVSEVKGTLTFLVCIKEVDEDGNQIHHWNSEINKEMYVSEGLPCDGESVVELYPDIVEHLLSRMDDVEAGLPSTISIAEIPGGHRVTVTVVDASSSFDVMDGADGADGENGATYKPVISSDGILSWANDKNLPNPSPVNIKGPMGPMGGPFKSVDYSSGVAVVNPFGKYRITAADDVIVDNTVGTSSATLPKGVYNAAIAAVDTNIYLFGGVDGDGNMSDSIMKFDTTTETATTLSTVRLPYPSTRIAAITFGTDIYLFGGLINNGSVAHQHTIYKFDTVNEIITEMESELPSHVNGATVSVMAHGSQILITDGARDSSEDATRNMMYFDPALDAIEYMDDDPQELKYVDVIVNGTTYSQGVPNSGSVGRNNETTNTNKFLASISSFNNDDTTGMLDTKYFTHLYGGWALLFGGADYRTDINTTGAASDEIVMIKTNYWFCRADDVPDGHGHTFNYRWNEWVADISALTTKLPRATCDMALFEYNNNIYLAGGRSSGGSWSCDFYKEILIYKKPSSRYSTTIESIESSYSIPVEEINTAATGIAAMSVAMVNGKAYLFGGRLDTGDISNRIFMFTPNNIETTTHILSLSCGEKSYLSFTPELDAGYSRYDFEIFSVDNGTLYYELNGERLSETFEDDGNFDEASCKLRIDHVEKVVEYNTNVVSEEEAVEYMVLPKKPSDSYEYAMILDSASGLNLKKMVSDEATADTIAVRKSDGAIATADPTEDTDAANKKYVDEVKADVDKEIGELNQDVDNLYAITAQSGLYSITEVEQKFSTRVTADGKNIVDGASAEVTKIQGATVATTNLANLAAATSSTTVTVTVIDNSTLRFVGTPSVNWQTYFSKDITDLLEDGKQYCASQSHYYSSPHTSNYFYMAIEGTKEDGTVVNIAIPTSESRSFTVDKSTYTKYVLRIMNGTKFDDAVDITISFMLNAGSTALPYRPYFSGLENTFFKGIRSTGKNLIPFPYKIKTSITKNGVTCTPQADGSIKVTGTATAGTTFNLTNDIILPVGETFIVSGGSPSNGDYGRCIVNIRRTTTSGDSFWIESDGAVNQTGLLSSNDISVYANIYVDNGLTVNATLYPMLQVGDTTTEYELYKADKSFMLDSAVELGAWDYIDTENKKLVSQTNKITIDGTKTWEAGVSSGIWLCVLGSKKAALEKLCVQAGGGQYKLGLTGGTAETGGLAYARIDDTTITSADQLTAYFSENPCELAYKTFTQVKTDLALSTDKYQAWTGGSETVIQGDTDNSADGAENTVTANYFELLGGTSDE